MSFMPNLRTVRILTCLEGLVLIHGSRGEIVLTVYCKFKYERNIQTLWHLEMRAPSKRVTTTETEAAFELDFWKNSTGEQYHWSVFVPHLVV